MRALVVEDDPALAGDLAQALRDAAFIVDLAKNGEDAWFQGDVEDYDVAVLDLGLPRLDGLSVLKKWRANSAHLSRPDPLRARRLDREGRRDRGRRG